MSEENQMSVGEMLRTTAQNTANLLLKMADHIDKLEADVVQLTQRVKQFEESQK